MSTARNFATYNFDEIMHQEILTKAIKFEKSSKQNIKKTSWKNRLLALLMIILIFSSMAFLLIRYAEINEIKYKNFGLKQDIKQMNIQVEELKFQIDSAMSLESIERYAIDKLNMQYPQSAQIEYIEMGTKYALNIENNDKVVDNGTIVVDVQTTEDSGFFAMIINTFLN